MIRIIGSILVLGLVFGVVWLTSEYTDERNREIAREDTARVEERAKFNARLSEIAVERDSAIADSGRASQRLDELTRQYEISVNELKNDRKEALVEVNELKNKLSAMTSKDQAFAAIISQKVGQNGSDVSNREMAALSNQLKNLQQRYDILDKRLIMKDEEVFRLNTELKMSSSIGMDLDRIQEIKNQLTRLPSAIDVAIPIQRENVEVKELGAKPQTKHSVSISPTFKPHYPLVVAPRAPKVKVVNKAVPKFVRDTRSSVTYPDSFGLPSGLPSGLRPIGY